MTPLSLLLVLQGWGPWAAPGWVMLMFGLAWMAAARLFAGRRIPVVSIVLANLCGGLSLLLSASSGRETSLLAWLAPGLLELWAQVLLWQVALALIDPRRRSWEPLATAAVLSAALLLWPGEPVAARGAGPLVLALAGAWLTGRAGWQVAWQLQRDGQGLAARTVAVLAAAMALVHVLRVLGALGNNPEVSPTWFAQLMLPAAFLANLVIANAVFGPLMRQLQQLKQRDALTGLPDQATVLQALAFGWRRPARRDERSPALLVATPDALADIGTSWGAETADALLVELAGLLRRGLPAGSVLGHAGDGRFLVLLPACTRNDAHQHAEGLVRRVAAEPALHPDAERPLTLSIGVALREPGDTSARALLTRAELQRLCAEHAGGNRAESAGLVRKAAVRAVAGGPSASAKTEG